MRQTEGTTIFNILLSVFNLLLVKYTGDKELVVNTAASNRLRIETGQLIGTFANNLILKTAINLEWSFKELLQQIRKVRHQALIHQSLPFEILLKHLPQEYSLRPNSLLQYSFNFIEENASRNLDLNSLDVEKLDLTSNYSYSELGERFAGSFHLHQRP